MSLNECNFLLTKKKTETTSHSSPLEQGVTKTKTLENLRPKSRLSFRDYEN